MVLDQFAILHDFTSAPEIRPQILGGVRTQGRLMSHIKDCQVIKMHIGGKSPSVVTSLTLNPCSACIVQHWWISHKSKQYFQVSPVLATISFLPPGLLPTQTGGQQAVCSTENLQILATRQCHCEGKKETVLMLELNSDWRAKQDTCRWLSDARCRLLQKNTLLHTVAHKRHTDCRLLPTGDIHCIALEEAACCKGADNPSRVQEYQIWIKQILCQDSLHTNG